MFKLARRALGGVLFLAGIPFTLTGRFLGRLGYFIAGKSPESPLGEIEKIKRRHQIGA